MTTLYQFILNVLKLCKKQSNKFTIDMDTPSPASHDILKVVYKPSLPRIMEDLSKPVIMEHAWDGKAKQVLESFLQLVAEQDIVDCNNELN